jgi:hypothetical protein
VHCDQRGRSLSELCHCLQDLTCNKINAQRRAILLLALYGCEIWSLTSREVQSLWAFEDQGVVEDIWAYETGRNRRVENTAQGGP